MSRHRRPEDDKERSEEGEARRSFTGQTVGSVFRRACVRGVYDDDSERYIPSLFPGRRVGRRVDITRSLGSYLQRAGAGKVRDMVYSRFRLSWPFAVNFRFADFGYYEYRVKIAVFCFVICLIITFWV